MAERGRSAGSAGEAAYQRLARRTEEAQHAANERVEGMFDTMLQEVRSLREEVRNVDQRGHLRSLATERRLSELEMQINMTRDEVQRRAINPAPSQIASAKTAIKDVVRSPSGRVGIMMAGITSAIVIGQNVPDIVRLAERTWAFLAGREVKAIEVVVPPKGDGGG